MNTSEQLGGEAENPVNNQTPLESAPVLSLPLIGHIAEGDSAEEITPELQAGSPVLSPDADSNSLTPTASFLSLEELQAQLTKYSADPEVEARATDSSKERPDYFDLEIDGLIDELMDGASDRSLLFSLESLLEHADSRVMSHKELIAIIKTRAKDRGISWNSIKERVNKALSNAKRTRQIALRSQRQLQALVTKNVADHLKMEHDGLDLSDLLFSLLTNAFPGFDDEELKIAANSALERLGRSDITL